jgi:hypothetical protein
MRIPELLRPCYRRLGLKALDRGRIEFLTGYLIVASPQTLI